MRLELFIASKYLKNRKGNLFISTMSVISMAMVVLFVAIPILTSSVTNGFQLNIIDKVYTFDYHLRISDPNHSFLNGEKVQQAIKKVPSIRNSYVYLEEKALMKRFGQNYLTNLRGMNPEDINNGVFGKNFHRIAGELKITEENDVLLAESLAANLFVRPGDTVTVAVVDSSDSSRPFNYVTLTVRGVFSAGYARYDTFLAYTSLAAARKLTRSNENYITTLGIYVKNLENIHSTEEQLKKIPLLKNYQIINSAENDIFQEFKKEKKLISIILYVAILISFLNIYITLNVIVVEKQKDIGVMKAFGVKNNIIQRVFLFEGFLIGIIGAFIGILLGLYLTVNIQEISHGIEFIVNSLNKVWSFAFGLPSPPKFEIMPQEKFYLSTLPYKITLFDVVLQSSGALLAALFAAYFPARRAAKKRPVEVLRNE